jgi:hypothetical protein
MTRTIVAIAAAPLAAMTLFASAAEACISCEYVPEVVRNSNSSNDTKSYSKSYSKSRSYIAVEQRRARTAKKRVVKGDDGPKKVETARRSKTAKPAAVDTQAENENSTFAGVEAGSGKVETTKTAQTPPKTGAVSEHSTISTATSGRSETADANPTTEEAPKVSNVGCKKFFPTVGLTLSVPCE